MEDYSQKAVDYFKSGYNCAQAVFLAFASHYGFDNETALKLSSSFGGGMGRLREVCGAVSSMFAIAGLQRGYTSPSDDIAKAEHYKFIQHLANEFKSEYGTIICRELMNLSIKIDNPTPEKRTEEYYKVRPCENFVRTAAQIVEREILKQWCKNSPVEENSNCDK